MINYNNPYNNAFYLQDLQSMRDRIDKTIQQYQQHQNQQAQMQPPITQNFQLAPTSAISDLEAKYANNIDEVKTTFVIKTGIFVNKDFSALWIKDVTGNIKTYKIEEVIELDEKDKTIASLQAQINELKGAIENANVNADTIEQTSAKKSTGVSNITKSSK